MNNIVLVVTHHDPEKRLLPLLQESISGIAELFDKVFLVATPQTDYEESIAQVVTWIPQDVADVGKNYHVAVQAGYDSGAEKIFYCDIDRIVHWYQYYKDELTELIHQVKNTPSTAGHLVLERTSDAYLSHHDALYETEQEPNRVISDALGLAKSHDFLAGACVYSKESARAVLDRGPVAAFGIYGAWPVAIYTAGVPISFRKCDGLSWETADRYAEEVAMAGGLEIWRKLHSSNEEWEKRKMMAKSFVHTL